MIRVVMVIPAGTDTRARTLKPEGPNGIQGLAYSCGLIEADLSPSPSTIPAVALHPTLYDRITAPTLLVTIGYRVTQLPMVSPSIDVDY